MFERRKIRLRATGKDDFTPLVAADPDSKVDYEALDCCVTPATADCLVSEGEGLSLFMYAGRSLKDQRTPTQTVGEIAGPAYMSHGCALHMFGNAEDPGDDRPATTEQPEDDLSEPLLTGLQESSVVSEPQTEAQFREKYPEVYGSSKSIVPRGKDPWIAVLGFNKFARWTPMLCSQYTELICAKEENIIVHGYEGWPEAGNLTFEGFTNWVMECKRVDLLLDEPRSSSGRTT